LWTVADAERSRAARAASERALVRVVHHYGGRPEFVVLGGLVPELLCAGSAWRHAGTTDVDVQVDLEVACGAVNTACLENALRNAEFEPDNERVWRWIADGTSTKTVVKFELLADLETEPAGSTVHFDACDNLGAVNLRGTGFASRDVVQQLLTAKIGGNFFTVEVNVTGLAGFLLAKSAAAYSRRKPKDWYDLAFVLLHNEHGGVVPAAEAVLARFPTDLVGPVRTALDDLLANFSSPSDQGPVAYAGQMQLDHPELDFPTLAADAVLAVEVFHRRLFGAA
jgi:hypothetical protein